MIIPSRVQILCMSALIAFLALPSASSGQIACLNYDEYLHRVGRVETPRTIWTTVLKGNYAYLGDVHGDIHVVDISDPQVPSIVGYLDAPESAEGLAISGSYLFVAAWVNGLQVIDISNPTSPAWVTDLPIPSVAAGLAIDGSYLYVAAGDSGLQVVDITDPTEPQSIGAIEIPAGAFRVAVKDGLAYVVGSELSIVDVSQPTTPEIVGHLATVAYSISLSGNLALLGRGGGFNVVDISNPTLPVVIGSSGLLPGSVAGLDRVGDFVYAAFGQVGFRIFDISNPASPAWVNDVTTFGQVNDVVVADGLAYLSVGGGGGAAEIPGLEILDLTQPFPPSPVGFTSTSPPFAMTILSWAYIVNGSGLCIVDIFDPQHPLTYPSFPAGSGFDIAARGNRVFIAGGASGLKVIDASNVTEPYVVGMLDTPGIASGVALDGFIAYVADGDSGLQVIDISDPALPVTLARLNFSQFVGNVTVSDSHAFLSLTDSLVVVDVSDPHNPFRAGSLYVRRGEEIVIAGNIGYLVSWHGLHVLDLTLSTSPQPMSFIALPGYPRHVALNGDVAYVLGGDPQVISVSDPYAPRHLGFIATRLPGRDLEFSNGLVYVAAGFDEGALMISPAQCSVPTPVELSTFTATASPSGIHLSWTPTDETQASGFHVHRSMGPEGVYDRLTTSLLSATGPHQFLDHNVLPGTTYSYRLEAVDRSGSSSYFGPVTARMESVHPRTRLEMNRPNPFGGNVSSTVIAFELAEPGHARLIVYDAAGRAVRTLLDGKLPGGANSVAWDGLDGRGQSTAPGLYFYRFEAGAFSQTHRLVRLN